MTTVLILGAGVMQGPSLRLSRAMGWRTVAADANPQAPCRELADRFALVDLKDREGMLALARSLRDEGGLDAVFTAGTDFSTTVSYVACALGLPCVPLAAAERATDKRLMRQALAAAGVPCPGFAGLDASADPVAATARLRRPLVVKPADSMGSRAVRRVETDTELREACAAAFAASRTARAVVEEFMEGPELSLDAIVHRGAVSVCGVADRIIRFPPHFVEMGHTMWTDLGDDDRRKVEEVFRAAVRALGIDNGAAKGDLKLTPRGPMVGEIAARLSGGFMSGWTFPLASGVEVTAAGLRVAAGLDPGDLAPRRHWTAAERAFVSIPGTVRAVEGVEEARALPGVRELFVLATPGRLMRFPTSNVEKAGNAIAADPSREAAVAAAETAAARILVRLDPADARTAAFLFGGPEECRHPAFGGAGEGIRRAIERLPDAAGGPAPAGSAVRLPRGAGLPLGVLVPPGLHDEAARDWHGLTMAAALQLLCDRGICVPVGHTPDRGADRRAIGRPFWRAFLRGSAQGGAWVVDVLAAGLEVPAP